MGRGCKNPSLYETGWGGRNCRDQSLPTLNQAIPEVPSTLYPCPRFRCSRDEDRADAQEAYQEGEEYRTEGSSLPGEEMQRSGKVLGTRQAREKSMGQGRKRLSPSSVPDPPTWTAGVRGPHP